MGLGWLRGLGMGVGSLGILCQRDVACCSSPPPPCSCSPPSPLGASGLVLAFSHRPLEERRPLTGMWLRISSARVQVHQLKALRALSAAELLPQPSPPVLAA